MSIMKRVKDVFECMFALKYLSDHFIILNKSDLQPVESLKLSK